MEKKRYIQLLLPFSDESEEIIEDSPIIEEDSSDELREDVEFIGVYSIPKKYKENNSNNFKFIME